MKIALITGITGQDGSYLAEQLLDKGYEVHGIVRRSSSFNRERIEHIRKELVLHYGDVTDSLSVDSIIHNVKPDEIYHLAAQSHVKVSFDVPKYTAECDAVGTLNVLEAMKKHSPKSKFYNATTSELFGKVQETPQSETTPFYPRSPYGAAKLYSFWITKNYREAYNLFAVNGILFNHESERRGENFVTRKIVKGLADFVFYEKPFYLGNIEAKRDWGYAPEYTDGMWRMLQHDTPEDFVLATGKTHTIKKFINESCKAIHDFYKGNHKFLFTWRKDALNRDILWDEWTDQKVIGIDEKYYRPAEVDLLMGDPTKAKKKLNWQAKTSVEELAKIMMTHELK